MASPEDIILMTNPQCVLSDFLFYQRTALHMQRARPPATHYILEHIRNGAVVET